MKKIIWKEGRIVSIKLRNGKYALIQFLSKKGWIAVFNEFNSNNNWSEKLNVESILFITFIAAKNIFSISDVAIHDNIEPVKNIQYPKLVINLGHGTRVVKLWVGTKQERELKILGDGDYILKSVNHDDYIKPINEIVGMTDYDKVKKFEMEILRDYPEFNERLNLCSIFNRNYDPLKELSFNQKLPKECLAYIDIIGGTVVLSDLGY